MRLARSPLGGWYVVAVECEGPAIGKRGWGGSGPCASRGVSGMKDESSSIPRWVVEYLRGLVGAARTRSAIKNTSSCPFIPGARLLLCPGIRRTGLASSANFSLAVALATPQAGVGLSSIGELDDSIDSSLGMAK